MRLAPALALTALALAGCQERWYSHDQDALAIEVDAVAFVDAHVVTPPEAWPRQEVHGDAIRLMLDGELVSFVGSVVDGEVTDEVWDVDDHWGDNVNILDAWDGCDHDAVCDRTFRFEVRCAEAERCSGRVTADAFISVESRPGEIVSERRRLDLELSLAPTPE